MGYSPWGRTESDMTEHSSVSTDAEVTFSQILKVLKYSLLNL